MSELVYGSACSGIEAATVAWHGRGFRPAWFSEIEKFPSAVLAHHYPNVPNLGDLNRIHADARFDPAIDVLVGGTPCQVRRLIASKVYAAPNEVPGAWVEIARTP